MMTAWERAMRDIQAQYRESKGLPPLKGDEIPESLRKQPEPTKHPDCEDRCQILEHKGYHDCTHTGRCERLEACK